MCVDDAGRQHEYSVPPPLIRKDLVAQMRAEAEETLPVAFVDCLRNIAQPFFTPIYDFSSPRLAFGRVALVGDAASSSRPHMGFGVAKAGGDAQALRLTVISVILSMAALLLSNFMAGQVGRRLGQA